MIISVPTIARSQLLYDHRLLALLQTCGFRLSVARLPDGRDKLRILRAVDGVASEPRRAGA